jgi:hypothetical protein
MSETTHRSGGKLAVISARSASKRAPGKSIRNLFGKPLIAYAIEQTSRANYLNEWLWAPKRLQRLPREYDADVDSPKRPLQTQQREWLRGPLREWASEQVEGALAAYGGSWLDRHAVRAGWQAYCDGRRDDSFFVWQWISLGLTVKKEAAATA